MTVRAMKKLSECVVASNITQTLLSADAAAFQNRTQYENLPVPTSQHSWLQSFDDLIRQQYATLHGVHILSNYCLLSFTRSLEVSRCIRSLFDFLVLQKSYLTPFDSKHPRLQLFHPLFYQRPTAWLY